jgi:YcxB-like protein
MPIVGWKLRVVVDREEVAMPEPVEIQFQCTEADYRAVLWKRFAHRFPRKPETILAVAFLAAGILLSALGWSEIGPFLICISPVLIGYFYFMEFVVPLSIVRRHPRMLDEMRLQLSDDGIIGTTRETEAKWQWSSYDEVREDERFYTLIARRGTFTIIPKRAFADPEQERLFRELLSRKIPRELD